MLATRAGIIMLLHAAAGGFVAARPAPLNPSSALKRVSCIRAQDASVQDAVPVGAETDPIQLELEQRPMQQPPPRTATSPGYVADPALRTWAPFKYAEPSVRRQAARNYVRSNLAGRPTLPPLRVVLMGGVATGKGTIAPMLSQAFRVRCIGIGALLRGEARAGRARGLEASRAMADGELLPDELVLQVLQERLGGDSDAACNGWLLDGFPRTESQARALVDGVRGRRRPREGSVGGAAPRR